MEFSSGISGTSPSIVLLSASFHSLRFQAQAAIEKLDSPDNDTDGFIEQFFFVPYSQNTQTPDRPV